MKEGDKIGKSMQVQNLRVFVYDIKESKNSDYKILKSWFSGIKDGRRRGNGLKIDIIVPNSDDFQLYGRYRVTGEIFWVNRYETDGRNYSDCIIRAKWVKTPDNQMYEIIMSEV